MHVKVWDEMQVQETGLKAIQVGGNMYDSMELMTTDTPVNIIRRYSPSVIILNTPSIWQIEVLAREGYIPPVLDSDGPAVVELDPIESVPFPNLPHLVGMINRMGRGRFRKEEFSLFLSEREFKQLWAIRWILHHGENSYSVSIKLVELYVQDAESLLADLRADEIENGLAFQEVECRK